MIACDLASSGLKYSRPWGICSDPRVQSFSSSAGRAQDWKSWGRWFKSNLKHININYKLYIRCLLNNTKYSLIENLSQNRKNYNVFCAPRTLYYLCLHLRLSSAFYSSQLVDIMAYEIPTYKSSLTNLEKSNSSVAVYNFHSLMSQDRFYLFFQPGIGKDRLPSVTELFSAANWLEREVAELSGLHFLGKKDLRNLMLQYGDSSSPFQKSFPSIGLREMFYDPIKDTLIQNPVSVQL